MTAHTLPRRPASFLRLFQLSLGLSVALLLGVGCAADPDPSAAQYGALVEYVLPERFIPADVWETAPPSCGGILVDDMIQIGHAVGAPTLGVVLDEAGHAICVDTWDAIHSELSRIKGDPSPDPMMPLELPFEMPVDDN